MKKEFIKKLSIAMASALIITSATPAAPASAKASMKMNRSSKIVYLNDDNMTNTSNAYDFSIKNKPSNWKKAYTFKWYAEDSSVVSVAKGGVVKGKKVGQTTVKCDVIKKSTKKTVKTVETVVTVKANADKVEISNAPEDNKMTIGAAFDFNRKMTAENGKKATDKTEWFISDPEVATVDKKGVVTALKAGKFTLTAKTYQSKATKPDGYTAESEAVEINVVPSLKAVAQKTGTKFDLEFDTDMRETVKKEHITVKNASGVNQVVKSVAFDATGKVATVELYVNMTDAVEYTVDVKDVATTTFKASVGEVAKVVVVGTSKEDGTNVLVSNLVPDNETRKIVVKYYDANGVEVSQAANSSISFSTTAKSGAWVAGQGITVFQIGQVVPVKATYLTGKYNLSTGEAIKIESEEFNFTCVDSVDAVVASANKFTVSEKQNGKDADWKTPVASVPVGDYDMYLHVAALNSEGKEIYTDATVKSDGTASDAWTFQSTDTSKLIIDKETGKLLPVATGVVNVICKNGTFTTVTTVNVTAKREAATISADKTSITLSSAVSNPDTIKLTVKDIYGKDMEAAKVEITAIDANNAMPEASVNNKVFGEVTFDGNAVKAGTYGYKLTMSGKTLIVTVKVVDPSDKEAYAKIDLSKNSVDMIVKAGDKLADKDIAVSLNAYATNGVQMSGVTGAKFTVKGSDGKAIPETFINRSANNITVKPVVVSGTSIEKLPVGTYKVEATTLVDGKDVATYNEKTIVASYFEVKDTQEVATVTTKSVTLETTTGKDIYNELLNCFTIENSTDAEILRANVKSTVKIQENTNSIETAGTYDVFVEKVVVAPKISVYAHGEETAAEVPCKTEVTVNQAIRVVVK